MKNKLKIISSFVLVILFFGSMFFLYAKYGSQVKVPEVFKEKTVEQSTLNSISKTECHDSDKYFVITKEDPNSAGEDILVKYKNSSTQKFSCEYIVENNDFELKNSMGQWFSFLYRDNLFLDNGTGSIRELAIYDLVSREKRYSDTTASSIKDLKITNNTINYWSIDSKFPTKQNCANLDEFLKMGSARIENFVELNLSNYSHKPLGQSRCVYSE
jgi:hypothetical protein